MMPWQLSKSTEPSPPITVIVGHKMSPLLPNPYSVHIQARTCRLSQILRHTILMADPHFSRQLGRQPRIDVQERAQARQQRKGDQQVAGVEEPPAPPLPLAAGRALPCVPACRLQQGHDECHLQPCSLAALVPGDQHAMPQHARAVLPETGSLLAWCQDCRLRTGGRSAGIPAPLSLVPGPAKGACRRQPLGTSPGSAYRLEEEGQDGDCESASPLSRSRFVHILANFCESFLSLTWR